MAAALLASSPLAAAPPVPPPETAAGLTGAYLRALDRSPAYRAARLDYAAALEARPQALSQFYPEINAATQYDWNREGIEGDYYGLRDVNVEEYYTRPLVRLLLRQPLYRRELFVRLDQADAVVARAGLVHVDARNELQLDVAEAYFGLLGAQEALTAARADRSAIAEQLEQVGNKHGSGLASDAELAATRAQSDLATAEEIQARNAVQLADNHLQSLTGAPAPRMRRLPPDRVLPEIGADSVEPWLRQAREHNTKLLAQALSTRIAQLEVTREQAGHWPTVDAYGAHVLLETDGGVSGARRESDSRVGVLLRLPVFSGFRTESKIREADLRARAAAEREAVLRDEVEEGTRAAFLTLQATRSRATALREATDSAEAALGATRVGYDVGTRTSADVLDAIRDRTRAERDHQLVRYGYLTAWLRLRRAAGTLSIADFNRIDLLLAD